jgi:hypothetical protein
MTSFARPITALVSLAAFVSLAAAQDGPPGPAPELQKLAPFVGSWQGSGTAVTDPSGSPSKWTAQSSYRFVLDGHFVQENTTVTFEDMPQPMTFLAWLGWDRENARYVNIGATSTGEAGLHEFEFLADGTMLQIVRQTRDGQTFAERSRTRVAGAELQFAVELLMAEGPSKTVVSGTMAKVDKLTPLAVEASATAAAPAEPMQKLARMAGTYAIEGQMVMMPGAPATKITGTDTIATLFGGTLLHVHTDGKAEGMPGVYAADAIFAWDARRQRFVNLFVSNMGEVGSMESFFSDDGKALISTSAALSMGQPASQRWVLELDAGGRPLRGVGHSLAGTHPPFECFAAKYTRK